MGIQCSDAVEEFVDKIILAVLLHVLQVYKRNRN